MNTRFLPRASSDKTLTLWLLDHCSALRRFHPARLRDVPHRSAVLHGLFQFPRHR